MCSSLKLNIMNIKGMLIYVGSAIILFIICCLIDRYGNKPDKPTPPGFRWGDWRKPLSLEYGVIKLNSPKTDKLLDEVM